MPDVEQEPIRPLAFIVAFVAAPLVPALLGLAVLMTLGMLEINAGPLLVVGYFLVGAVVVGGIPYLVVGIPGLIHALSKKGKDAPTGRYALMGHILSMPIIFLITLAVNPTEAFLGTLAYLLLGSLFAPLWGLLFSIFYNGILDRGQAAHV